MCGFFFGNCVCYAFTHKKFAFLLRCSNKFMIISYEMTLVFQVQINNFTLNETKNILRVLGWCGYLRGFKKVRSLCCRLNFLLYFCWAEQFKELISHSLVGCVYDTKREIVQDDIPDSWARNLSLLQQTIYTVKGLGA